jgi:DNA invertase Pin-like site-specific DNA recombinase
MTRAAIYARFSSDLQRDRSIEDQIEVCRSYAERMHFDVVEVYADRAKSGASMHGRDGIQRMIAEGRERVFDVVIAETLSRLGRDEGDRAEIRKRLTFAGVKIMTPSDGEVTRLTDGIKAIIDAQYLEDLKLMIRRGMAGVTRDGRHAGGRAYGYRPVPGKPGELEIVEAEADIIRRIFREFAAGESARAICIRLNAERLSAPRGDHWSDNALNGNRSRGHGILINPIYGGTLVWNRTRFIKDPDTGRRVSRLNPEREWQSAPAPHLAIVDADTIAAVQARLRPYTRQTAHQARRPKTLLSGLLKCGCCGAGLSIKDRRGGRVRLHCAAARQGACANATPVYLDTIEPVVLEGLKARLRDKRAISLYLSTYNAERRAVAADAVNRRAGIERRLSAAQRELDRVINLTVKGIISEGEAAGQLPALRNEKATLEAELSTIAETPKVVELHPTAISSYLRTVDELETALAAGGDATEHPASTPIRSLIDRVVVTPAGLEPAFIKVQGRLAALVGEGVFQARMGVISGSAPPLPPYPPTKFRKVPGSARDRRRSLCVALSAVGPG